MALPALSRARRRCLSTCLARKLSRKLSQSSQHTTTVEPQSAARETAKSWLSVKRGFFDWQYAFFIFSTPLLGENVEHTQKSEEGKEILNRL